MPTRKPSKSSSKGSKKVAGAKRVKVKGGAVLPLEPIYLPPVKVRAPKKGSVGIMVSGGRMSRIWGDFDDDDIPGDIDWNKVPRMPNPMPDNIVSLLKLASEATWLTIPLAPFIYLLIKSWFEGRNTRKLKIKKGNSEVEFEGTWSERKLRNCFDHFRKMNKDVDDDSIQVIENGKVIKSGSSPAYKITEADLQRVKALQGEKPLAKRIGKKSARKGIKKGTKKSSRK